MAKNAINPIERNLSDMIASARGGNTSDAREVVETIKACLQFAVSGRAPLPKTVADVLIDALNAGLQGESINAALGLIRRGRQNEWEWQAKAMTARIVQELLAQGMTLDVACETAPQIIQQGITSEPTLGWRSFHGKVPSEWNCRSWYTELIGSDK
jgi:hypothetical protein